MVADAAALHAHGHRARGAPLIVIGDADAVPGAAKIAGVELVELLGANPDAATISRALRDAAPAVMASDSR